MGRGLKPPTTSTPMEFFLIFVDIKERKERL
jgi:hypothetical protein